MKGKLFLAGILLLFCMTAFPQAEGSLWTLLKQSEIEPIFLKAGFKIEKTWDGIPAEYQNLLITTSFFSFAGGEELSEPYKPYVTIKINNSGVVFSNRFKFSDLLANTKIWKTFLCKNGLIPYVIYAGDNPAFIYVMPLSTGDNQFKIYTPNPLGKEIVLNNSFVITSVEKAVYEDLGYKGICELPLFFGHTRNEALKLLGDPSNPLVYGRDQFYDYWKNQGITLGYDEGEAIKQIEINWQEGCKDNPMVLFDLQIYDNIQDTYQVYGEPESIKDAYGFSKTAIWKLQNYKLEVTFSTMEQTNSVCNRTIGRGAITGIKISELIPSSMAISSAGDAGYLICNRYINRGDLDGLTAYLKTKPDISFKKEYDRPYTCDNPVLLAISRNQLDMLELLLENGGDPNFYENIPATTNYAGISPIEYVLQLNYPSMVKCVEILCKKGLNINSAIAWGLYYQNTDCLDAIVRSCPDFLKADLSEAFFNAIALNRMFSIKWLIEHGMDPNKENKYGKTYMKMGLSSENPEVKNYFKQLSK